MHIYMLETMDGYFNQVMVHEKKLSVSEFHEIMESMLPRPNDYERSDEYWMLHYLESKGFKIPDHIRCSEFWYIDEVKGSD